MKHRTGICALIIIGLILSSFSYLNDPKPAVKTIVIDAGHGGHDPGCHGGDVIEKNVTLAIALDVGKYIEENIEGVKVIFTRKDDHFVELWERAAIANRNGADLFISIHCNANDNKSAYGTETYAMGLKSQQNLELAKRENSVILMEDNYMENYDGFDPKSPEGHIIFSLYQDVYIDQSLKLAQKIEHQFSERVQRKSRGVKQAPFVVLWRTTMPSVLVETGFLTNPTERKYLSSELGQSYIASGIYRAVRSYKEELEKL